MRFLETFEVVVPEVAEEVFGLVVEFSFANLWLEDGCVVGIGDVGGDVDVENAEAVCDGPVDVLTYSVRGDSIVRGNSAGDGIGGGENFDSTQLWSD